MHKCMCTSVNLGVTVNVAVAFSIAVDFIIIMVVTFTTTNAVTAAVIQHFALRRRVFKDTGRLLVAFLIGSAATVAGTLVAFKALPLRDMGADGWKVSIPALNTMQLPLAVKHNYLCFAAMKPNESCFAPYPKL